MLLGYRAPKRQQAAAAVTKPYSVPHALIRAEFDVRIAARAVEIFHRGQRVGVHQRRYMGRKHGTHPDHMPSSHRRYAEWTPDRFRLV